MDAEHDDADAFTIARPFAAPRYREIVTPGWLAFVVSFSDEAGGGTMLTMRGEPVNATDAERDAFRGGHASMRDGWSGTLDQLTT